MKPGRKSAEPGLTANRNWSPGEAPRGRPPAISGIRRSVAPGRPAKSDTGVIIVQSWRTSGVYVRAFCFSTEPLSIIMRGPNVALIADGDGDFRWLNERVRHGGLKLFISRVSTLGASK